MQLCKDGSGYGVESLMYRQLCSRLVDCGRGIGRDGVEQAGGATCESQRCIKYTLQSTRCVRQLSLGLGIRWGGRPGHDHD